MSVRKVNVVDVLRIENGAGGIVLDLIDEEDWSDVHGHLLALQEKLNSYLAFIESGEVYEQLEASGQKVTPGTLPIRVDVHARCPLHPHAQRFLEYVIRTFEGAGFRLSHRVVDDS